MSGPEAGVVVGVLGEQHMRLVEELHIEIRERARAEQAARVSEQRLALALDIVNMGTWDWDIAENNIVWSNNVEALHGLAPGTFDFTYESWFTLVHPEDQEMVNGLVEKALHDGVGHYDAEFRICRPDGQQRWLRGRGQVYYDDAGVPNRLVGTVLDVTQRHLAESQLRLARREAEEARAAAEAANAAKNDFLSRMSHELRTPLNAVLGFAQLLELDVSVEQRSSVRHIRRAGRHLLELINEVLDIARIESGDLNLSPEPVLVSAVVRETLDLMGPLAAARDLRISVAGDEEALESYVVADHQRIKQVLLNLLSNAVKYNREGGEITVKCRRLPDPVHPRLGLTVVDTGIGIASADLDRLFVPFERLGAEHTAVEGTGVGLALTQRLVQAMGGELQVLSGVGKGSSFTVTLAAASDPQAASAARASDEASGRRGAQVDEDHPNTGASASTMNLLYIEDNASNARLLEHLVARRPGWQLTVAEQGRLGLELAGSMAADSNVHLILLDLHLPDMTGTEVLRRVRAEEATAGTPVVVLSADATPGQVRRLIDVGADRYLTKPFDVAEVLDILDRVAAGAPLSAADVPC